MLIGGGITGDMQTNDTARHRPLKYLYWEEEEQLMHKVGENAIKSQKHQGMK